MVGVEAYLSEFIEVCYGDDTDVHTYIILIR